MKILLLSASALLGSYQANAQAIAASGTSLLASTMRGPTGVLADASESR